MIEECKRREGTRGRGDAGRKARYPPLTAGTGLARGGDAASTCAASNSAWWWGDAAPATGSAGALEDEDEDEDEDERMLYREPMRELAAAADGTVAVVRTESRNVGARRPRRYRSLFMRRISTPRRPRAP